MTGHETIGIDLHTLLNSTMLDAFFQNAKVFLPCKYIYPVNRGKGNKISCSRIMKLKVTAHENNISLYNAGLIHCIVVIIM